MEGAPLPQVTERWLDIPGYEGRYQVSDEGRVRSLDRTITQKNRHGGETTRVYPGRVLEGWANAKGYLCVGLSLPGERPNTAYVHHLVVLAFVGPRPAVDGEEIRHLDDNKSNCRLTNLLYGTSSQNTSDWHRNRWDIL